MTIDPRSLSSEERAIVDTEARRLRDLGPGRLAEPNKVYICALANMTYFILARRALFGEPASEPYKAETTADRIAADLKAGTFRGAQPEPAKVECDPYNHRWSWGVCLDCGKPAQPDPVATPPSEMPEAVRIAIAALHEEAEREPIDERDATLIADPHAAADALESWWRSQPATAAVRMTIDAHRMQCAYPDGSVQELAIDDAMEFSGAVAYQVGEEIFLTSRACLFNVGPSKAAPESSDDLGHVVITCEGIDGTPTYLAHASHARVRRGVWQWREAATGDRYLATIPCTASPQ